MKDSKLLLETLKINMLSKQYIDTNLKNLIVFERDYPEPWLPENFLMELPKKWVLSRYVEFEGDPVGFIIASLKEDSITLHRFMIDPNYRDLHLGETLYWNFEAGCKKVSKAKKITLNVLSDNLGAIKFYERLGYKIFDEKSLVLHCKMEKILAVV